MKTEDELKAKYGAFKTSDLRLSLIALRDYEALGFDSAKANEAFLKIAAEIGRRYLEGELT